jgi:hypothetical protein
MPFFSSSLSAGWIARARWIDALSIKMTKGLVTVLANSATKPRKSSAVVLHQ